MNTQTNYLTPENAQGFSMRFLHVLMAVSISIVLISCEKNGPEIITDYYTPEEYRIVTAQLDLPLDYDIYSPFEAPDRPGSPDQERDAIATLGRVLFYDVNLSIDNTVSCGSCHRQELAFSDNVAFSDGVNGTLTTRNSIALGVVSSFYNYANSPSSRLFWDRRALNLHDQMIGTLRNPNEMGMEVDYMVEKLNKLDYYQVLSKKAFGTEEMDPKMALDALETFMSSIVANNTLFDAVQLKNQFVSRHGDWNGLTIEENQGKNIFMNHCASCHKLNAVSNESNLIAMSDAVILQANNGLELNYTDKGMGEANSSPEFIGVFKIPGLRNIELTGPYMHDGRFNTIEEVIDFYSEGIQDHPNLHPLLKENGHAKKLNLTEGDKHSLVQFLKTLTDHSMIRNEKWSDPFLL